MCAAGLLERTASRAPVDTCLCPCPVCLRTAHHWAPSTASASARRVPLGQGTHIDLLGGEGANAHACGVGFHHAVDLAYVLWGDAQARAHATHGAVG